ncbi:MATE efflux family protein 1 [Platanthera guangdongensis]|uniref:MATE efflux family protein 1 n=1 Tax=Platanthera guangdongensis TaxID=2320717 RepID=A0ABR2MFH3_9ASPA
MDIMEVIVMNSSPRIMLVSWKLERVRVVDAKMCYDMLFEAVHEKVQAIGSCGAELMIGPVELAAVGVSIAVFNQVSRVAIFPLVGVTTSFVAEEDATTKMADEELEIGDIKFPNEIKELLSDSDETGHSLSFSANISTNSVKTEVERKHIPSVSTALVIGGIIGLLQTILLVFGARPILNIMGVKPTMPLCALCRAVAIVRKRCPHDAAIAKYLSLLQLIKIAKTPPSYEDDAALCARQRLRNLSVHVVVSQSRCAYCPSSRTPPTVALSHSLCVLLPRHSRNTLLYCDVPFLTPPAKEAQMREKQCCGHGSGISPD